MLQWSERRLVLLEKAHSLPRCPGVYLMNDVNGVVIYVGKAIRLPSRVSSYFLPSTDLGPRKQRMLECIADFDFIPCESEWEALLAENRLIKDIKPRFNVSLTDDKTYPYLVITLKDDFPGVFITRQPNASEYRGAKVFGPFLQSYALRQSVQMLQKVFKFRTCHLEIREEDDKRKFFRPCLLYPIKQCTAPCGARISKEDYRKDIDRFIRFLESKRTTLTRELKKEMIEASEAMNYERAAELRDQIQALDKLEERGSKKDNWQPEAEDAPMSVSGPKAMDALRKKLGLMEPIRCMECIDIAHLQGGETVGSKVSFIDGRPFKDEYRRYKIKVVAEGRASRGDDYAAIREVVSRRYRDAGQGQELYPDVIQIDGGLGQLHAAMEAFDQLDIHPPMVISLAKKEELIYMQGSSDPIRLSRHDPALRLCQAIRDEAHRFAQRYHHLLRSKSMLGDKLSPRRGKKRDGKPIEPQANDTIETGDHEVSDSPPMDEPLS